MKKGKMKLFLSTTLALFAVIVGGVSTYAWFQLDAMASTGINTGSASNSTGVTVSSVTGYKGRKAETSSKVYSSTQYITTHYDLHSTHPSPNVDEDEEDPISLDTPQDGVGYYLLGDAAFTGSATTAWKYAGGVKMTTESLQSGYSAFLGQVYLTTSMSFGIYHHYYDTVGTAPNTETETKDDKYYYGTKDVTHVVSDGYYNIRLSTGNVVSATLCDGNGSGVLQHARFDGPTKRSSGTKSSNQIVEHIIDEAGVTSQGNDFYLYAWGFTLHSNCVFANVSAANNAGAFWSAMSIQDNGNAILFSGSFEWYNSNQRSYKFYFPWWITACTYKIKRGNDWCNTEITTGGTKYERRYFKDSYGWKIEGYDTATQSYNPTAYTMSYISNSGSAVSSDVYYEWEKTSAPSSPTKTGYTFSKWTETNSASASAFTFGSNITSDKTLYAQWTANAVTVTLDPCGYEPGGRGRESVSAVYETAMPSIAGNLPTKTGYTFAGYFTGYHGAGTKYYNADGSSAHKADFVSPTTLHAHWTISSGTDIYVLNNRSWSNVYVKFYFDDSHTSTWYHEEKLNDGNHGSGTYGNIYKFKVPSNADRFLLHSGTIADNNNSTKDFDTGATWQDCHGRTNTSLGTYRLLVIQNANAPSSNKSACVWRKYQSTAPAKGYYLMGGTSSLSGCSDWTFAGGAKMNHEGVAGNDSSQPNKAELRNVDFTQNYLYEIWGYDGTDWLMYEENSINTSDGKVAKYYALMKASSSGKRNVFLNYSSTVFVKGTTIRTAYIVYGANRTEMLMMDGDYPYEPSYTTGQSGHYNRFVHESPVTVAANDTFYLKLQIEGDSTTTNYYGGTGSSANHVTDINSVNLLTEGTSMTVGGTTIVPYKFKTGGKYTFYWTKDNQIAVAPVPELGYGYYALINQGTLEAPSWSYANCKKFATIDGSYTNKAVYYNFYLSQADVNAGRNVLAFRSYIENVDKYYLYSEVYYNSTQVSTQSQGSNNGAYPKATSSGKQYGVVLTTKGYYNMFVTGSGIYIASTTEDTQANFFRLNTVPSSATTKAKVKAANTSFVLGVDFTVTSSEPCAIEVLISGGASGLGSKLVYAVSAVDPDMGVGTPSPYDYMRKRIYDDEDLTTSTLSNGRATLSTGSTISANNAGTHTLYIFIDYNPSSVSGVSSANGDFSFYIRAVQA